jgi:hypothetical protein
MAVVVLVALVAPSLIARSAGQEDDHFSYLPLVLRAPEPQCPPMRIFDRYGVERDWAWLEATFGYVSIEQGSGSACVVELRDELGPATITVRVVDTAGEPLGGITVIWYWPDANFLPPELVGCFDRGDIGVTKTDGPDKGTVGFGMGGGSYYDWPGPGPHTVWVGVQGSDCVHGLGMLSLTNHRHLNPTFMLTGK